MQAEIVRHPAVPISEHEQEVLALLRKIRFGALEIIIHDGKVVQLERKEKTRFPHVR